MEWSRTQQIMAAFTIGFILDMICGDPRWKWHPVRLIGNLISAAEGFLRRHLPESKKGQLLGGGIMACVVPAVSTAVPVLLLWAAYRLHPVLGVGLEGVMLGFLFAAKSLRTESMAVYHALSESLPAGRRAVSMIVGRDTETLDETGVIKAAVETVAENTSDGVIAPMLAAVIGGAPLAFFYKAVNTMDSMAGYKNEKYLYFGRAAARLDDVVNFIPARISAVLMIPASVILKMDGRNALRIFLRDRKKHASPNSAQTEAVMAGALGVELAGDACYFGKAVKKPVIGDALRPVEREDIKRADRLMILTAFLGAGAFLLVRVIICLHAGGMQPGM